MPLNQRVKDMLHKYGLRKQYVEPEFSYRLLNIAQPTWTLEPARIDLNLAKFPKVATPRERYIQEYYSVSGRV